MKYYIDTEFIEYPRTIDLISIGIVCADGREFYAESWAVNWSKASGWVIDNVKPHLNKSLVLDRSEMKKAILEFVKHDTPEFWGYYCDYDWVAFCWIFGTMMELPKGWPMYCRDLRQALDERGLQNVTQGENEHNALSDAIAIKKMVEEYLSGTDWAERSRDEQGKRKVFIRI